MFHNFLQVVVEKIFWKFQTAKAFVFKKKTQNYIFYIFIEIHLLNKDISFFLQLNICLLWPSILGDKNIKSLGSENPSFYFWRKVKVVTHYIKISQLSSISEFTILEEQILLFLMSWDNISLKTMNFLLCY